MDRPDRDPLLSATLLAGVEAVAAIEKRSSRDVLQEAVELFLRDRRLTEAEPLTASRAAKRMLERRHRHRLPEGETLHSLMTYGRM